MQVLDVLCLPALKELKFLGLEVNNLQSIPAAFAVALKSLEVLSLDLEDCVRLPSTLSHITTLTWLRIMSKDMELQDEDIPILESLPSLLRLSLPSVTHAKIAGAIQARLPNLMVDVS